MPHEMLLFINCSVSIAGFMLALLGLIMSIFFQPIKLIIRKLCTLLFGLVILYTATNFISYFGEIISNRPMIVFGLFAAAFSSAGIMPVVTLLILYFSGENAFRSPLMQISSILLFIYYLMLSTTLFSPLFYSVSPTCEYTRGVLYPYLLVPPFLNLLINLIGLWMKRRKMSKRQRIAMLGVLLPPILAIVVQIFYEGILSTAIGIIMGSFTMLIVIMLDQVDLYLEQKERNAQQDFEIKVLQMRPHFIYNTMTSIYYLIDSDKEKAKNVVRDFTVYLRKVFSSVVKTEMIPFEEELQHTKAYLAVEEARFGDQLHAVFDLPDVHFRIPPLTLQPVVENAVKHGMDPESAPLTIEIRTQEKENEMLVVVSDNGVGYNFSDPGDPHTALGNIEARIREFCKGSIQIDPGNNGIGTRVVLHIPKG